MWKIIQFLFSGCWHRWEILAEGEIKDGWGVKVGTYYNLQCKNCGDVKMRNLI